LTAVSGGRFPHSTAAGDYLRRFDREELLAMIGDLHDAFSGSTIEK